VRFILSFCIHIYSDAPPPFTLCLSFTAFALHLPGAARSPFTRWRQQKQHLKVAARLVPFLPAPLQHSGDATALMTAISRCPCIFPTATTYHTAALQRTGTGAKPRPSGALRLRPLARKTTPSPQALRHRYIRDTALPSHYSTTIIPTTRTAYYQKTRRILFRRLTYLQSWHGRYWRRGNGVFC